MAAVEWNHWEPTNLGTIKCGNNIVTTALFQEEEYCEDISPLVVCARVQEFCVHVVLCVPAHSSRAMFAGLLLSRAGGRSSLVLATSPSEAF